MIIDLRFIFLLTLPILSAYGRSADLIAPSSDEESSLKDSGIYSYDDFIKYLDSAAEVDDRLRQEDRDDLEPADEYYESLSGIPNKESVEEIEVTKEEKKGNHEFISYINPKLALKSNSFPEVQVKRSQEIRVANELRGISDHHPAFMVIVGVGTVAAAVAMVGAAVIGYKVKKNRKAAEEAQYPQYGVIGPSKDKKSAKKAKAHGDATMAYGAHLHHYQQTKQQIIDMDQPKCERAPQSDESDVEVDEADYSVYECPGLAPTGNIEIANPLFEGKNGRNADSTSSDPDGADHK